jgi:hypothetical protein
MTEGTLLAAEAAENTEAEATASAAADKAGEPGKTAADPGKAAADGDGKAGAADDKAGDKAKDDEGKKADDDKAKAGAPETYEGFKLPDGMELDSTRLEAFTPLAKELNLNQENAQKLVDFYADAVKAQTEAQVEAWAKTQKEWRTETENDKEIGGQNLTETLTAAKAALKAFGDAPFVELMEQYGMGNNKTVLRFLAKVGKTTMQDGMPAGGANPKGNVSRAATLYTNPTSKPA